MPYAFFYEEFPDVAERETRTITLPRASHGLPAGTYAFPEMYCNEAGCDCRRVMLYVCRDGHEASAPEAVVAYGWEDRDFYARWLGMDDSEMLDELQGPVLNDMSPQGELATKILELANNYLLADPDYVERLKRHYAMFREKVERAPSRKGFRKKQRSKRKKGKRKR